MNKQFLGNLPRKKKETQRRMGLAVKMEAVATVLLLNNVIYDRLLLEAGAWFES